MVVNMIVKIIGAWTCIGTIILLYNIIKLIRLILFNYLISIALGVGMRMRYYIIRVVFFMELTGWYLTELIKRGTN